MLSQIVENLSFLGIILATWSASISNLIGASRVVYAVALDKIFGPVLNIISRGSYKDNPILAVLITGGLIQLCFLIGKQTITGWVDLYKAKLPPSRESE